MLSCFCYFSCCEAFQLLPAFESLPNASDEADSVTTTSSEYTAFAYSHLDDLCLFHTSIYPTLFWVLEISVNRAGKDLCPYGTNRFWRDMENKQGEKFIKYCYDKLLWRKYYRMM